MWNKLGSLYLKNSLANRLYLKKKLYTLQLDDSKQLSKHMDEFNRMILDLKSIGVQVDDEDQAIILLSSLPSRYKYFVDTLLYGKETLGMVDVKAALNSKEIQRGGDVKLEGEADALVVMGRFTKKGSNSNAKYRRSSKSKGKGRCFHCNKEGYFKNQCPDLKSKSHERGKNVVGEVSCVEEAYESSDSLVVSQTEPSKECILDSGCSYHMCPNRGWFEDMMEKEGGLVFLGNNKSCKIQGVGSIRLKLHDGMERLLKEVRYVPELKRNLISLGEFDRNDYTFKCDGGNLKVCKCTIVILTGVRMNGVYTLQGKTLVGGEACMVDSQMEETKLWHQRLGHVSQRGIEELHKQGAFGKMELNELEFCEHCVMGKARRLKFSNARHNSSGVLDYVHSDLWGPTQQESHGGASDVYPFLEKMCLLGTRVESKFAVRAISSLMDSSDDLTFSNLCQKLVRSLQCGQNIPTILQCLTFIARHSFRTYMLHEKKVTDYIVRHIFGCSKVHSAVEESFLNGDLRCSSYCKLKIYGMKALFKCFLSNQASQVSQQIKERMSVLENTIKGDGIIFNNISGEIDKDCLRLTATKLLLLFSTRYDSYIPSKLFHLIIATTKDPSCAVRKTFLHKVHELLKENLIPLKYACAFALASTDFIGDIRASSKKYLAEFVEGRRIHNSSSQDEKRQVLNSPEYIVVFLIHILAHDPGFRSENLEDVDFYPELCSPLVIILRALVDLEDFNGNTSDMLANLFAILRAIRKADDANDAHVTPKLHALSDIAMLILKSLGKGLKPASKLHRMILLPSSFYKVCQDSSKVYDYSDSFFNASLAKRILDVVDSSFIKPLKSSSKQCGKSQVGANRIDIRRENSENLFEVEDVKPVAPKSKWAKYIEPIHANALDKELLQKRNPTAQPLKTCSVSNNSHNENTNVDGRRNSIPQNSDTSFGDEQLSSCNSASTELYFPGLETLTTEHEVLNPLLMKRITKCDSIASRCDQNHMRNNCLTSKESVHKGKVLVRYKVCRCPPIDMCACSGSFDSCDSQQNSYKVSYDNGSVELFHLENERWESKVQKPSMDNDPCGFQPKDCNFTENTYNIQTTLLGESAKNYKHLSSTAIVENKKAKRQRQSASSARAKDDSKNVARKSRPQRIEVARKSQLRRI